MWLLLMYDLCVLRFTSGQVLYSMKIRDEIYLKDQAWREGDGNLCVFLSRRLPPRLLDRRIVQNRQ